MASLKLQVKQPLLTLQARNYTNECTPVDISSPQDGDLDEQIPGGQALAVKVQDSAENDFPAGQIQAQYAANLLSMLIADYSFRITATNGDVFTVRRSLEPSVLMKDTDDNLITLHEIISSGSPTFTAVIKDTVFSLNGVEVLTLLASVNDGNIQVTDPDGVAKGAWNAQAGRWEVPAGGIEVDFSSDVPVINVGEVINFFGTAPGADTFLWKLGADRAAFVQNPQFSCVIPGVYDVVFTAFTAPDGPSGAKKVSQYLTINGLADKYSGMAYGWAPVLLQRTYSGSSLKLRRASDDGTTEVGHLDGELDVASIESFAAGADVFVERVYIPDGSGRYYEQLIHANQPQIASSGSVLRDGYLKPTLQFNGTAHFQGMADYPYWSSDRTKLYTVLVITPGSSGSLSNYMQGHWDGPTSDRSHGVFHDDVANQLGVIYSSDGSTTQLMRFNTLSANDQCVIGIIIDTTLAADERVKAWKNLEPMTFSGRTGSVSGNLKDSAANITIGATNPSSGGAGNYTGKATMHMVFPSDKSAVRAAIEQDVMNYLLM